MVHCRAPGERRSGADLRGCKYLPKSSRATHAFSLVEILIVVGLLSLIVLGLMAMFGKTQQAFRIGMTQTDVLEGGRASTDLIARDLEPLHPSYLHNTVNFYAEIPGPPYTPLLQDLPGSAHKRTNMLADLFFLTCENRHWTAIGYRVSTPLGGVGTLYRYVYPSANYPPINQINAASLLPGLLNDFINTSLYDTNKFSRMADGVVHLRVRAFDTNGVWITPNLFTNLNLQVSWQSSRKNLIPGEIGLYGFLSNAVPAAVEIELGFLESRTLDRAKGIPDVPARREYVERQAGRVHLFRQRIPIRSVDPEAYQ